MLSSARCSPEYCSAVRFNSCFGEVAIPAYRLILANLRVKHTPQKENGGPAVPNHVSVYGFPLPSADEGVRRNFAFEVLAMRSDLIPRKFKRKKK